MAGDPEIYIHKEWLGLLQPVGLVISPPALVKAQAAIDRSRAVELQQRLQAVACTEAVGGRVEEGTAWIHDFPAFAEQVLGWMAADLAGAPGQEELPVNLEVVLPDYGETLRATYAVRDPERGRWLMLIQSVGTGLPLDEVDPETEKGHAWKVTLQAKFERLLREAQIPIGLLCNGTELRLVYAPRGESSGHLTFPVQAMAEVSGRLILGALDMLLGADRLFNVPSDRRLPKILSDSREYQAEVSTKLASQVLDALWELLRGFQSADAAVNGALLQELAKHEPQHIYGGLITTLMRLVFLLYAEDEGLMPDDEVYQQNYAVSGLYERLREDVGNYPDTMDQRYGAWTWLLSLFRLVYDGGGSVREYLPARHGQLFTPDEYPFLEGRSRGSHFHLGEPVEAPRIPDGVIYRVLDKLLMLDGERLSYRSLDVEQIGSVYEAIMGFEVEVAQGLSIAVRPKDVVVNVEEVLREKVGERAKRLQGEAECKLTPKESEAVKDANTAEELVAGLGGKVSSRTPNLLPVGSLFLQPGEERRRTGSHYTPRKLTQPIVETTLRPVLERLGEGASAEQLLELKVCDLAMGSGAFLVEACRQLAEKVVEAWTREGRLAELPDDVEPLLAARRLVAQRCLYGVDKNLFAVNLAKLSLWLVTLAKDRPFTFVDHALKGGDSLVGLTRAEIEGRSGDDVAVTGQYVWFGPQIERAVAHRRDIQSREARTDEEAELNVRELAEVEEDLNDSRLFNDALVAAFFEEKTDRERGTKRREYRTFVTSRKEWGSKRAELVAISRRLRSGVKPIMPFGWEVEFPEVFDRENPGFDAIVGNPPFAGKNTTINGNRDGYVDWLKEVHPESHGNADIVAHFFRRAFTIVRKGGSLGLIATNTIAQGDTRSSGLRFICNSGGTIYNAQKRMKWPGLAAVVVSVVNIYKGEYAGVRCLDGRIVETISAFLFPKGGNENPRVLVANGGKSFQGSIVLGMGFTFDDTNPEATPIAEVRRLIAKDARNAERIFPYIGGEEVNSSPGHEHRRYVINFGEMSEEEARRWPDLMGIVEEKVKPERDKLGNNPDAKRRKTRWWLWGRYTPALFRAIAKCDRVLVISRIGQHGLFAFLPTGMVYSESLVVFPLQTHSAFATLQSRPHEIWARFFGSSMKDDLRYTPTDCFETFPFPENWQSDPTLESIGQTYYTYRANLMLRNNQGLTDTYNRFHDPAERDPDILKLRELHAQLDRAVLAAYGWSDIDTTCGFALDYLDTDDNTSLPPEAQARIASGDLFFPTADEACAFDSLIRSGTTTSKRKLPWRYKWPEATHDEVLARLLDLNQQRFEEENLAGKRDSNPSSTTKPVNAPRMPQSKKRKTEVESRQLSLFGPSGSTMK